MTDSAIRVTQLSKRYRIGARKERYKTFQDSIISAAKAPFRRLGRLSGKTGAEQEMIWALKDVSFEVKEGEVLGIIGQNGSGKSTLLKVLSRITKPTGGRAEVYGRIGSLLEVGTGFHPELTGRENIYLNGAVLGMRRSEITAKFDEIVDFSGIEQFLDTPVKRYSSGMNVRLAFAVAAHLEPEILLVDEVLAVGDMGFQNKCLGKMSEVTQEGRTVLFVSHNMSLVSSLCRRVLFLSNGSLIADEGTASAIRKYMFSTTSRCSADLEEVGQNRIGQRHDARLLKVAVFDEEMVPTDTFSMGNGMVARVEVLCEKTLPTALVGLKISSRNGSPIHYFVSTWEGLRMDLAVGRHIFEFRIPRLLIYPGTYFLTPWVGREGRSPDDTAERALILNVLGRDITGHTPDFDKFAIGGGEVYSPSECSLIESMNGS